MSGHFAQPCHGGGGERGRDEEMRRPVVLGAVAEGRGRRGVPFAAQILRSRASPVDPVRTLGVVM